MVDIKIVRTRQITTNRTEIVVMKIGAFIQARMSSQRFPGKVLKEIKGKPLLLYLVERLQQCSSLDELVIATSDDKSDEPVIDFCASKGISYFIGSLKDVAKRFRDILDAYPVDAFIRINGDSPLLDQRIVAHLIDIFCKFSFDFVTNAQKRTFPKGQSVEVVRRNFFCTHYPLFANEYDREHVTPYFYRNMDVFNFFNLESGKDWGSVQLSIDTPEDFLVIERMIQNMDKHHWKYDLEDLMSLRERTLQA